MNSDFEKQLRQQPLKKIPAEWRSEILAAARSVADARPITADARPRGFLSTLNSQLSALLWPCPQAWAGLAAIWILIFVLNASSSSGTRAATMNVAARPQQIQTVLLERRRELSQLLDSFSPAIVPQV